MRFVSALLAGLLAVSPAGAATIVQTRSLHDIFAFSAFDSSLGTLNSATVDASATLARGWYYRDDPSETTGQVSYVIDGIYNFWMNSGPVGSIAIAGADTLHLSLTSFVIFSVAPFETSATGTGSFGLNLATVSDVLPFFITGSDPYFAGGPTPDTTVFSPFTTDIFRTSGCNQGAGVISDDCQRGTITLTYDYTPSVPEPTTWAMMIVGFGLVGFAMRRRSQEPLAAS